MASFGVGALASSSVVHVEKIRLRSSVFGIPKVAQTDAHEPIKLLWTQAHSFSELKSDIGQFLAGGRGRVWRMAAGKNLELAVFSLRTTVRAIRDSFREADQSFSARRRIMGSVSDSGTSCSNVSSTDIDWVGRSGMTSLSSIPRASSCRRTP